MTLSQVTHRVRLCSPVRVWGEAQVSTRANGGS